MNCYFNVNVNDHTRQKNRETFQFNRDIFQAFSGEQHQSINTPVTLQSQSTPAGPKLDNNV